ncbi:MAG: hypothetical protein JSS61_01555 [Verrucomicrobia bacterium]|nr:hypothetical protein [Verrucomicrobiota bacterium]
MSTSLSAIQNSYVQKFPDAVPTKTAQSFILTVVINLAIGATAHMALVGGALASTATLIEAVTRPIIREIFPENPQVAEFIQIVMPYMIVIGLATTIAPWVGVAYKTSSVLLPVIGMLVLNNSFYARNVGRAFVL